jgi:hypothetical protein
MKNKEISLIIFMVISLFLMFASLLSMFLGNIFMGGLGFIWNTMLFTLWSIELIGKGN